MSDPVPPSPARVGDLPEPVPHAGIRYALMRLGLLVVVGLVLYAAGMRGLLLVAVAFLLSGVISYFALMRPRDAAAANLERRVRRRSAARREHASAEPDGADEGPGGNHPNQPPAEPGGTDDGPDGTRQP